MNALGILLLLVGIAVLGYGVWLYNEASHAFDFATVRSVTEGGDMPHAVWIGGGMIIAGTIVTIVTRNKRR